MLVEFPSTMKKASKNDSDKSKTDYMTLDETPVIDFDEFKNYCTKSLCLPKHPSSCDALFMTRDNLFFLIEFKNGKLKNITSSDIKYKMYDSLLMLSEKLSRTTEFMRNNLIFIFVYNEDKEDNKRRIKNHVEIKALGLEHLERFCFKKVYAYSKTKFESEFISKYCK